MKTIPLQTQAEAEWVKEYLLLPLLLDILERDIVHISEDTGLFKFPQIYILMLHDIQRQVMLDLTTVRRQLRQNGLKVYEQHRTALGLEASYLCRGYEHSFSILWGLVKANLEERLCGYMGIDISAQH
ncbi:hypothetical protein J2Z69_000387 [Paenibacillus shirakamiensis]|uniref:Uncharacterized protein n=1 Tax=Paenibacillus shirakamiensis TaxID=1265935 RepID=A0ABS4JCB5_9BACL|nr:hypothetical protein [Paenibacillus shirakamiensis]MBP1999368.1 hypothetical protein [Paenibacillus shirakamiensis]